MPINQFPSAREAKEFLVSRIVDEAQRENVLLSEVERKMLYYSEGYWTLPDMSDVSTEFDRDYDQMAYEKKIAGLVARAAKRARKESREEYAQWWAAIRRLKREDHYILVMVTRSGLRPPGDSLKLFATALGVIAVFMSATYVAIRYDLHWPLHHSLRYLIDSSIWIGAIVVFAVYWFSCLIFGRQRVYKWIGDLMFLLGRKSFRKNSSSN
jgi:hypothetical protein